MTANMNATLTSEIEQAKSFDDLKSIMLKMVATTPVISQSKIDGWIRSIETDLRVISQSGIMEVDPEDDRFPDDYKPEVDADGLIQLKFIKSTRKEWSCFDCKKSLPVGSEAFRSFKLIGHKKFDKRYRCITCIEKLVVSYNELAHEAHHLIALYASQPSHGQE